MISRKFGVALILLAAAIGSVAAATSILTIDSSAESLQNLTTVAMNGGMHVPPGQINPVQYWTLSIHNAGSSTVTLSKYSLCQIDPRQSNACTIQTPSENFSPVVVIPAGQSGNVTFGNFPSTACDGSIQLTTQRGHVFDFSFRIAQVCQ